MNTPVAVGPCPKCKIHIGPMSLGKVVSENADGSRLYACAPWFTCNNCGQEIVTFLVSKEEVEKALSVG